MDTPDDGGALMGTRIGQRALDEVPGPTGDAPLRRLRAICLALPRPPRS